MRTENLGDLLFGQTRGRILALLYGHSDQTFFIRQIARHVHTSVGTVQRELKLLSHFGLIDRTVLGVQVFYQVNRDHPAFPELKALISKTVGIFPLLRSALVPLSKRISLAFVYGSMARGEENATSDVDLMIIGDITLDEALMHLGPLERVIGRSINPTLYSADEFQSKLEADNHFIESVLRGNNVLLMGDEDEFRKMGSVRLAQSSTAKPRGDRSSIRHSGSRSE